MLFDFIYPSERAQIPLWVRAEFARRTQSELASPAPGARVCYGTLLSRGQYPIDVERWGYRDSRIDASMSREEVAAWTAAIDTP